VGGGGGDEVADVLAGGVAVDVELVAGGDVVEFGDGLHDALGECDQGGVVGEHLGAEHGLLGGVAGLVDLLLEGGGVLVRPVLVDDEPAEDEQAAVAEEGAGVGAVGVDAFLTEAFGVGEAFGALVGAALGEVGDAGAEEGAQDGDEAGEDGFHGEAVQHRGWGWLLGS
jgi:hypothetical protein